MLFATHLLTTNTLKLKYSSYEGATAPVSGSSTVPPKCPSSSQITSPVRPIRVRNKSSDDTLWLQKFEAVKEYVALNGNSNIQTNYECSLPGVDGKCKLGIWLNRQKFNKKSGVLRDDRFVLLDSLVQEGKLFWPGDNQAQLPGEVIEGNVQSTSGNVDTITPAYNVGVSDDAAWIQKVNLLKSLSRDGNSNITSSYVTSLSDGSTVRLGLWLKKQRQMRKGGMLKPNREAILQQMVDEGYYFIIPLSSSFLSLFLLKFLFYVYFFILFCFSFIYIFIFRLNFLFLCSF